MSPAIPRPAPDSPPAAATVPPPLPALPVPLAPSAPPVATAPPPPPAARHRRRRLPTGRRAVPPVSMTLLAAVVVVLLWAVVVWVSPYVQVAPALWDLVRFGHLAALVLGFGAALTVEWFGLLWLLGRRPLSTVSQVAQGAHLPIWLGLAGLTVSGMLMSPAQPTTAGMIKLGAVLVVALNGVYAARLQGRLTQAGSAAPRSLLARAALAGGVSQLGWWSAVVIGFLAARA